MKRPNDRQVHTVNDLVVASILLTLGLPHHISTQNEEELKNKIQLSTPSVHKEFTKSGRKLFGAHPASKQKLSGYNLYPFAPGLAKQIATVKEMCINIVNGLLTADDVGNET